MLLTAINVLKLCASSVQICVFLMGDAVLIGGVVLFHKLIARFTFLLYRRYSPKRSTFGG
jgi:hypothetical protein